jgi:hypothetical protein
MWKFSAIATCILLAVCLCARVLAQPVAQDLVAQRSAHLVHFREKPLYFYRSPSTRFIYAAEMKNSHTAYMSFHLQKFFPQTAQFFLHRGRLESALECVCALNMHNIFTNMNMASGHRS